MERYIIIFKGLEDEKLIEDVGGIVIDPIPNLDNMLIADLPKGADSALMETGLIDVIERDGTTEMQGMYDRGEGMSFGHQTVNIKALEYWKRGITGNGIKVGIVDSGVAPHRDIEVVGGLSAYATTVQYTDDFDGHGSHCAGIVGARHNGLGSFLGIAPGVQIYSYKCDDNKGSDLYHSAIIKSMDRAISDGIRILNCSFGGSNPPSTVVAAYDRANKAGILIVGATGNGGKEGVIYPARLPYVIGVGNSRPNGTRFSSSNWGEGLDVMANGASVVSFDSSTGGYTEKTGTSMATPAVVGIAALYMQLFPSLTADQIRTKIIQNTTKYPIYDTYVGYGLPQPPVELFNLPIIDTKYDVSAARMIGGNALSCKVYLKKSGSFKEVTLHKV